MENAMTDANQKSRAQIEAELANGTSKGNVQALGVFSKSGRVLSAPGMSAEEVDLRTKADWDPERMRKICDLKVEWGDMTRAEADEHFRQHEEAARRAQEEVEKLDADRKAKGLVTHI
jgi:hypothetical protein